MIQLLRVHSGGMTGLTECLWEVWPTVCLAPFQGWPRSRCPGKIKPQQAESDVSFSISYKLSEICSWGTSGSKAVVYVCNSHHHVFLPVVCPITFWVHVHFAIRPGSWAWCHSVMTLPAVMVLSWPCWLALALGPVLGDFTWGGSE